MCLTLPYSERMREQSQRKQKRMCMLNAGNNLYSYFLVDMASHFLHAGMYISLQCVEYARPLVCVCSYLFVIACVWPTTHSNSLTYLTLTAQSYTSLMLSRVLPSLLIEVFHGSKIIHLACTETISPNDIAQQAVGKEAEQHILQVSACWLFFFIHKDTSAYSKAQTRTRILLLSAYGLFSIRYCIICIPKDTNKSTHTRNNYF